MTSTATTEIAMERVYVAEDVKKATLEIQCLSMFGTATCMNLAALSS